MEAHGDCPSGVWPGARTHGASVSLDVPPPPAAAAQARLAVETRCEGMTRQWRQAGHKTDGRPGVAGDGTLSVPCGVVLLGQPLHARAMESSRAEHGVARVCRGRQDAPSPQLRAHAKMARASTALGQDGGEEVQTRLLQGAQAWGGAARRIVSSETTAQAWPMGAPNDPGMVWGGAPGRSTTDRRSSDPSKSPSALPRAKPPSGRC